MDLSFKAASSNVYINPAQKVRVLTEHWVGSQVYCPACGAGKLSAYPNNHRATDFRCPDCEEDYELKSKSGAFGSRVVDGAYQAMLHRLAERRHPNLFLLSYNRLSLRVADFVVIPGYFLTPQMIEPRKPLATTARRAGWTGCNIRIDNIPLSARIFLIRQGEVLARPDVLTNWRRVAFVRNVADPVAAGWMVSVMQCVDRIGLGAFALHDVYRFEAELGALYPGNNNVRAKIRQQLQVLRDRSYLEFLGKGRYRVIGAIPA